MQIVVWNSRGAKWNELWNNYIAPVAKKAPGEDVIGFVVEAGWAPWVASGNVVVNEVYPLNTSATWFDKVKAPKSDFCKGVQGPATRTRQGTRSAFWIPWVTNPGALNTNSRCSMGAVAIPKTRFISHGDRIKDYNQSLYWRPILRIPVKQPARGGGDTTITVFLVHLKPGDVNARPYVDAVAQAQLASLLKSVPRLVPQATSAIVVGDFNIDILGKPNPFPLPKDWTLVRKGVATQASTLELDYALLFDPVGTFKGTTPSILDPFKSQTNTSDHAVMQILGAIVNTFHPEPHNLSPIAARATSPTYCNDDAMPAPTRDVR